MDMKMRPRVNDAIDSMKDAFKQDNPQDCEQCFHLLSATMEDIARNPAEEEYYLRKWAEDIRLRKIKNICRGCHPPIWENK